MLSFKRAVEEGVNGIETDVRKTSDDVYVLMHDDAVDRTTDGTGLVSDLSWNDVSMLDAGGWRGREFAGRKDTKIPRLDRFLDHFMGTPVYLCLQIKLGLPDCLRIADMINERDMMNQCFLFANKQYLASIRSHSSQLFLVNDGMNHNPEKLLEQAIAEGWNAISPGIKNITEEIVKDANSRGIYVMASYVSSDYENQVNGLIDIGCNFILGNDCTRMAAIGKERGCVQIVPK